MASHLVYCFVVMNLREVKVCLLGVSHSNSQVYRSFHKECSQESGVKCNESQCKGVAHCPVSSLSHTLGNTL